MSDLIDRQATIDAVQQHRESVLGDYKYDDGVAFVYAAAHNHIIYVIKQLPSAEPTKGHWVPRIGLKHPDWFTCSKCTGQFAYKWNYCPNCGADMRKES